MGKTLKQRQEIKRKAQHVVLQFNPEMDGYRAMAGFLNQAQERGATAQQAFQSLLIACVLGIRMANGDVVLMFMSAIAASGASKEEAIAAIELVYGGSNIVVGANQK